MTCPAHPPNDEKLANGTGMEHLSRGNYAACYGKSGYGMVYTENAAIGGLFGNNSKVKPSTVTDGLSSVPIKLTFFIESGHAPTASLILMRPEQADHYRLGTTFRVDWHGFDEDPGDEARLVPEWTTTFPAGSGAQLVSCPEGDPLFARCFTAIVKGDYVVRLQVSDGILKSAMYEVSANVIDDQPACLGTTSLGITSDGLVPAVYSSSFDAVVGTVDDDLDPFPPDPGEVFGGTLRWFVKGPRDPSFTPQLSGIEGKLTLLPNTYVFGDEVLVRVEVLDRNVERSERMLANCTTERCVCPPEVCQLRAQPCYQRMTWHVRYK